jgi:hypothetical protein
MNRIFLSLVGFITLSGLLAAPVQSRQGATNEFQTQTQPEAKKFSGTIQRSGENFVLSDSATKSRYMLDNQNRARPYEGKNVEVTGTFDVASNLIYIDTIEEIV